MAYVPPKYPTAIPTTDDLPNRADDVDWLYAARYNELKKELRAIMIELGISPSGASADVATRLGLLVLKSNVLELDNTTPFTPDADHEPATKKYVDDSVPSVPSDAVIKGWVQFSGIGVIVINDSYNVAGLTDYNTGDWGVTWDVDFANGNYAVAIIEKYGSGGEGGSNVVALTSVANNPAAGSVRIWAETVLGAAVDDEQLHVIAIGDQ